MSAIIRRSKKEDFIFDSIVDILLLLVLIITLYPMLYVLAVSFSSPAAVQSKSVWLWPVGFNLESYKLLAIHPHLGRSYINTILYTAFGTAYSLILTLFGAYALSRKNLIGRDFLMFTIFFTMIFSGGIIPTFLVVNNLRMYNSWTSMIFPCAISAWNLIIVRTFMQQIPESMEESAKIDGANDIVILFKIYIPMCIPVIATVGLFYGVGKWNDYFSALIYLSDVNLYPLQLVIRNLIITMTDSLVNSQVSQGSGVGNFSPFGFRTAVVIVSVVPIIAIYPFLQKYFVKGTMIGAIKG